MSYPVFYSALLLTAMMAPALMHYRRYRIERRLQRGLRDFLFRIQ